jgi:hypothetical protein
MCRLHASESLGEVRRSSSPSSQISRAEQRVEVRRLQMSRRISNVLLVSPRREMRRRTQSRIVRLTDLHMKAMKMAGLIAEIIVSNRHSAVRQWANGNGNSSCCEPHW